MLPLSTQVVPSGLPLVPVCCRSIVRDPAPGHAHHRNRFQRFALALTSVSREIKPPADLRMLPLSTQVVSSSLFLVPVCCRSIARAAPAQSSVFSDALQDTGPSTSRRSSFNQLPRSPRASRHKTEHITTLQSRSAPPPRGRRGR